MVFLPAEKEETEDIEIQAVFGENQKRLTERTKTMQTQSQESTVKNTAQDSQALADKKSLSQKKQVDAPSLKKKQ